MGGDSDPHAVLHSKFRVRGVKGPRMVDASVFPKIPGFFRHADLYDFGKRSGRDSGGRNVIEN
jgi:choline dehydrogenase